MDEIVMFVNLKLPYYIQKSCIYNLIEYCDFLLSFSEMLKINVIASFSEKYN